MRNLRLFRHVNTAYAIFSIKLAITLGLNGTLSCVDFMDAIMGGCNLRGIFETINNEEIIRENLS